MVCHDFLLSFEVIHYHHSEPQKRKRGNLSHQRVFAFKRGMVFTRVKISLLLFNRKFADNECNRNTDDDECLTLSTLMYLRIGCNI